MEQLQLVEIIKFIHLQDQELLQCSCAGNALGSNTVDYLVVAGGGGGGKYAGGGGGAGGYRESSGAASGYTASPLGAVSALPVTVKVIQLQLEVVEQVVSATTWSQWFKFNFFNNNISRWW